MACALPLNLGTGPTEYCKFRPPLWHVIDEKQCGFGRPIPSPRQPLPSSGGPSRRPHDRQPCASTPDASCALGRQVPLYPGHGWRDLSAPSPLCYPACPLTLLSHRPHTRVHQARSSSHHTAAVPVRRRTGAEHKQLHNQPSIHQGAIRVHITSTSHARRATHNVPSSPCTPTNLRPFSAIHPRFALSSPLLRDAPSRRPAVPRAVDRWAPALRQPGASRIQRIPSGEQHEPGRFLQGLL